MSKLKEFDGMEAVAASQCMRTGDDYASISVQRGFIHGAKWKHQKMITELEKIRADAQAMAEALSWYMYIVIPGREADVQILKNHAADCLTQNNRMKKYLSEDHD